MDKALAAEEDPLYISADKPLILTRKAAKALGIKPVEAKPNPILEPQASVKLDGQVIPELNGYTAVTIRSVEPDGLRIIHESGASKISIEKLTEEQRAKYGLTVEVAAQYRKQVAESTATNYARQQQAAIDQAANPDGGGLFLTCLSGDEAFPHLLKAGFNELGIFLPFGNLNDSGDIGMARWTCFRCV